MDHVVMIIDDSEADLLFTQIVLERSGRPWRVLPFESARDALGFLTSQAETAVELILLDINMPAMNGFEFLDAYEQLRSGHQARAVVVMLTSSPDPGDRARAMSFASVRGYVQKPIDIASARARALPALTRCAAGSSCWHWRQGRSQR